MGKENVKKEKHVFKHVKPQAEVFETKKKAFSIGSNVQPKRDLRRFLKWPRYIRLQRQRRVLMQRLKVPPAIAQFSKTVDKNMATNLFRLLAKYKPEDLKEKRARLLQEAKARSEGKEVEKGPKPKVLKYGLNHVTTLIESKKAQLVIIAHDVDPIELVVCLPALCRRMGVAYCIVKGKARLGQLVHLKNATCVAVTEVEKEDMAEFAKVKAALTEQFNDRYDEVRKVWGGGIMGQKTQALLAQREKIIQKEMSQKFG